jgi:SAM-dependent methyltransferase
MTQVPGQRPIWSRFAHALRRGGPRYTAEVAVRYLKFRARAVLADRRARRFDRRFGVDTRGVIYYGDPRAAWARGTASGQCYQAVDPKRLARALEGLPDDARQRVFIDVGCGKGMALMVAAESGFRRVIGVDLLPELVEQAHANLTQYAASDNGRSIEFEVEARDATNYTFPPEPSVVFLYNPFGEEIMAKVLANLERSLRDHPRPVYVMYLRPTLVEMFDTAPFLSLLGGDNWCRFYTAAA